MAGNGRTSRSGRDGRRSYQNAQRYVPRDSNRAFVVLVLFFCIAAIFLVRLIYLQIIVAPEYSSQAQESRTVGFSVEPRRGTIYDRNGNILAISVDATTIYANPSEIEDVSQTAEVIASVLGGDASDYEEKLTSGSSTFTFIKRKADVSEADALKEKNLQGIYFISDTRREYPYGQVGGQIIGAVNIVDDAETGREYYEGISGLEYYYDDVLSGTPGYYEAEVGADGTPIPGGVHEATAAVEGQDIVISIDIEFQEQVENYLTSGLNKLGVSSGTAVVMDASTGEIYAAASIPLFNPADRSTVEEGSMQLKAVSNIFEPGSIFKTVSAMALLETNSMTPDTVVYCPSSIEADGYVVSDAHDRGDEYMTLREIVNRSSNVGISLSVEEYLGFEELYNYILKYNFDELTGVDYPGEQLGYLLDYDDWSRVTGYNVSFGQGISVNAMQMVRFYGALVNNGYEVTPHFLLKYPQTGEEPTYETEEVIENKTAISQMTSILQTVVSEGTGTLAAIDGYDVAGKTSTAEIYDEENGGYRDGVYNIASTGYIANSSSQLVCFVGADEVYGDSATTFIFKDIMSDAISRYHITSK